MTRRPRPMVRHRNGWWWIFVGHSDYTVGDRYTTPSLAADAARKLRKGHR